MFFDDSVKETPVPSPDETGSDIRGGVQVSYNITVPT